MDHVQQQHHVEDVGRILLQTQEQLRLMREQVGATAGAPSVASARFLGASAPPDVRAFQEILERAEHEIRVKAELVLNGLVNTSSQATALPAVTAGAGVSPKARPRQSVASLLATRRASREENNEPDIEYFRARFHNAAVELRSSHTAMPSPVQRIAKGKLVKKRMAQHARLLPSVNKCDPSAPTPELSEQDAKSGMFSLVNRGFVPIGADLTPAFVNSHGSIIQHTKTRIYDRQEQPVRPTVPYTNPSGFNVAALKFDIAASTEVAHDDTESPQQQQASSTATAAAGDAMSPSQLPSDKASAARGARGPKVLTVHFQGDVGRGTLQASVGSTTKTSSQRHSMNQEIETESSSPETNSDDVDDAFRTGGAGGSGDLDDGTNDMDELRKNVEKVRGYNELLDTYSLHQFIIHKGRAMRETPEFVSFKRVAQEIWGSVEDVIKALEALLTHYFVPLAYIDGQRLMALAGTDAAAFSSRDLLACVVNDDQNCFRTWSHQRMYMRLRRHVASVETIQRIWRAHASHADLKRKLQVQRAAQHAQWVAKMQRLQRDWPRIKCARRVVIHVPSLSIDERARVRADNFAVKQNLQLARLAALVDPNVEVVYVSPFELTPDVAQYSMKLLQLGGIADPVARVKLVYPEQAGRFPAHFSLTSLLLYSPHCLRRIQRYVKNKEAYLVTGTPGAEDYRLAVALDVAILGMDPRDALPLMTKSGAKRFFMRADVNVPTGTYDIYDEDELVFALAKLVVAHIEQNIWVLKLDYDPLGTGTAVLDVSRLAALREIRREKRSPEYWKQPGTRDNAARVLIAELERSLERLVTPLHTDAYASWSDYAFAITQFGVVIEAAPSRVVGHVRANVFVEPSGDVHVSSTQDIIDSNSSRRDASVKTEATVPACLHKPVAYAFPQATAPYEAIRGASSAIGRLLIQDAVFGYASVDFLVFHEDKTHAPRLWAMALHPFLTDSAATFATFHLLSRGAVDPDTGLYHLAASPTVPTAASLEAGAGVSSMSSLRSSSSSALGGTDMSAADLVLHEATHSGLVSLERTGATRSYVVSEYICHPSVSTMQYSAFFHTCRLHGVCFDVERCVGTVFLLADSLTAGVFGAMCCSDAPSGALAYLRTALEVIAREVGVQPVVDDFASESESGNFASVLGVVRALTGGKSAKLEKIRRLRRQS